MANDNAARAADKRNRPFVKIGVLLAVLLAVALTLFLKGQNEPARTSVAAAPERTVDSKSSDQPEAAGSASVIPKLVDLGAGKCIPCKMMAPILEQLKQEFAGRLDVQFIDVWENPDAGKQYGISVIPTQIFYDATGKERFRHEGFYSREDILGEWKKLGVNLGVFVNEPAEFSRFEPAVPDSRPKESICYMCDGDINPKTRTVLRTEKGDVAFCSPHCYFIAYSSMTETKPAIENILVTDWLSGTPIAAAAAKYVYGVDSASRPTTKAFADSAMAIAEQRITGGNVLDWPTLQGKELATRCGFCDRAVYPEDACAVKVDGLSTWGCCTMCALGVAARLQKDIEVTARDALTGETISVKTADGHVGVLEPQTSVAWAGTGKDASGKLVSTGCFKQAFFVSETNLRKWVDAHPAATGRMTSIEAALAEKMSLTPQQISKACKIGECVPK